MSDPLFEPARIGDLLLANRIVMAPMTRNRARADGTVPPMMVSYYRQRASAGLIVTESTPVSPHGVGYPHTPALYNEAQAASWRSLTAAVHDAGGRVFVQLQHCGRISHPSLLPAGALPLAPSPLRPQGQAVTYAGMRDYAEPRALEAAEIDSVVGQFGYAAVLAQVARFDGIEIHGANGYLIDQFLRDGSNRRDDDYGGSAANRMRLLERILDAVCSIWPASRVGVRLSPENAFNAMSDSDPQAHFGSFVERLAGRGLAYLHVLEGDMLSPARTLDYAALRARFGGGRYLANHGYDVARARGAIANGQADLIAFGTPFIANPDLVRRLKDGLPLSLPDRATFYGGGEAGYTDYPTHRAASAAVVCDTGSR